MVNIKVGDLERHGRYMIQKDRAWFLASEEHLAQRVCKRFFYQ